MKRYEIDYIGGPAEIARILGLTKSAISMWFKTGSVPYKHAVKIKDMAAKVGKDWSIDYIMNVEKDDEDEIRRDFAVDA